MTVANWYLGAKANATNLVVASGLEKKVASFKCTKRFNTLGVWELILQDTVSSPSTYASIFLQDASGNLHNGIFFEVDNQDGNGLQYVFSGPQTDVKVDVDAAGMRTIMATGFSEEYWLAKRRAFQVPHYPYPYLVSSLGTFFPATFEPGWYTIPEATSNLLRFYTLGDTSGTTAVDSKSAINGTYTGGFTLNQNGLIDDPKPCVLFNGTTGYVSLPTTSLPTGNSAWTMTIWFYITSNPGSAAKLMQWGNWGTNRAAPHLAMNTSGQVYVGTFNGDTTPSAATGASLNTPHFLVGTWDGTNLLCYLDGKQVASATPGALAVTLVQAFIGKDNIGEFFPGYLQHAAVYNINLSAASIANLYAVGISRQAYLAYDAVGLKQASLAIIYYAQRNTATTGAPSFPDYGTAAP